MNDILVSSLISKQQDQGDLSCFIWRLAKPGTVYPPALAGALALQEAPTQMLQGDTVGG